MAIWRTSPLSFVLLLGAGLAIGFILGLSIFEPRGHTPNLKPAAVNFDGESFAKFKLPSLREFTLDLKLTAHDLNPSQKTSPTTPPMPLLTNNIRLYQYGKEYLIWGGGKVLWRGGDAGRLTRITIFAESQSISLYHDGKKVYVGPGVDAINLLWVGLGLERHFWRGAFDRVHLWDTSLELQHDFFSNDDNVYFQGADLIVDNSKMLEAKKSSN